MSTSPQPIFDMSKATPIFDMSKAQPLNAQQAPTPDNPADPRSPTILEKARNSLSNYLSEKDQDALTQAAHTGKAPEGETWATYGPRILKSLLDVTTSALEPKNAGLAAAVIAANSNPVTGIPVDAGIMAHGAYGVATNAKDALAGKPDAVQNALLSGAEVAGAGAGVAGQVKAIPSAAHAGQALQEVKTVAGDVPIDMAKPGNTALELYEQSQRGATLPKVVRDFVKRATQPGSEPITYQEAKDFQSNVSSLSADERMALKPNTKRLLGQLNADLKSSLEDAADTQGKGEQFADAMKEYHDAMRIKGLTEDAKSALWKASITAGLGATAYKLFKMFSE